MLHIFPTGSEHEYLQWLVSDRYQQSRDALEPICDRARDELLLCNFDESEKLFAEFNQRRKELLEQRWHSEDIVYRLHLDSQLRAEGSLTLPDIWEEVDARFEPLEKKLEGF